MKVPRLVATDLDGTLLRPDGTISSRTARVLREIESPRPLGEVVAGVTDPQFKEQLYTLAFTIVRADEAVTG